MKYMPWSSAVRSSLKADLCSICHIFQDPVSEEIFKELMSDLKGGILIIVSREGKEWGQRTLLNHITQMLPTQLSEPALPKPDSL